MKTVKEMHTDLLADIEYHQQLEREQQQKKIECQQAVALAEKEMQEALARQDQEAYHAAEGKLSYAKEVLRTFEAVDVWWTQEEAQGIADAAYNAYCAETKEKAKAAYDFLMKADDLFAEIHHISLTTRSIISAVGRKKELKHTYGFPLNRKALPTPFMNEVARMAGESYIPPAWMD